MVKLIANRRMQYATRQLRAGDVFDARPKDARILVLLQRADLYVEPPKPKRGKKAADPVEVAPEVVAEVVADPVVESVPDTDQQAD